MNDLREVAENTKSKPKEKYIISFLLIALLLVSIGIFLLNPKSPVSFMSLGFTPTQNPAGTQASVNDSGELIFAGPEENTETENQQAIEPQGNSLSGNASIDESQATQAFSNMDLNASLQAGDYSLKVKNINALLSGQDLLLEFEDQNVLVLNQASIELTNFNGSISKTLNEFKVTGSVNGMKVNGVELAFVEGKSFSLTSNSLRVELNGISLESIELIASGLLSLPDILITLRENDGLLAQGFTGDLILDEGISLEGIVQGLKIVKENSKLSIQAGQ